MCDTLSSFAIFHSGKPLYALFLGHLRLRLLLLGEGLFARSVKLGSLGDAEMAHVVERHVHGHILVAVRVG